MYIVYTYIRICIYAYAKLYTMMSSMVQSERGEHCVAGNAAVIDTDSYIYICIYIYIYTVYICIYCIHMYIYI